MYFSHCSFLTVHSIRNYSSSHTPIYTHKHPYTHDLSLTLQPLHQTLVRDGLLWAVLQSLQRDVQHSAAQQFKSAVCGKKQNSSWTSVIRSVKVIHTSNTKYSTAQHIITSIMSLLILTATDSKSIPHYSALHVGEMNQHKSIKGKRNKSLLLCFYAHVARVSRHKCFLRLLFVFFVASTVSAAPSKLDIKTMLAATTLTGV